MRHMHVIDRPLCEQGPSTALGEGTRAIYHVVDCADCLRRVIAETEDRLRVLHELLEKASS